MKMKANLSVTAIALMVSASALPAQFVSGSTGADGALDIQSNTVLPVQEDGVHNYTTINVAGGVTLSFSPNTDNTPVIFLATGDVTIDGTINLDGQSLTSDSFVGGVPGNESQPGPGGYPGGLGGIPELVGGSGIGSPGGGPGGGAAGSPSVMNGGTIRAGNGGSHVTAGGVGNGNTNPAAPTYGDARLLTLTGGSGGAGGNITASTMPPLHGPRGGAGGGALTIASSTSITVNGSITANGGHGNFGRGGGNGNWQGSGGGGGGAIRLVANTIGGTGMLRALGGSAAGGGGLGRIRLEGVDINGPLPANSNPGAGVSRPSVIVLDPGTLPTIEIVSIGGEDVTIPVSHATDAPEVIIPDTVSNPMTIAIATTNIPNGSVIKLRIILSTGDVLDIDSSPVASNAATAMATLPPGSVGVIYATADFP
jgi:hypothetical protein